MGDDIVPGYGYDHAKGVRGAYRRDANWGLNDEHARVAAAKAKRTQREAKEAAALADGKEADEQANRKDYMHFVGNRKTRKHLWSNYEVKVVLGMLARDFHTTGFPLEESVSKHQRAQLRKYRRQYNEHLQRKDHHAKHNNDWFYEDCAQVLNDEMRRGDKDYQDIAVRDVREMMHRLLSEHKHATKFMSLPGSKRLTKAMTKVCQRKIFFTGTQQEWEDGRKEKEEAKRANEAETQFNAGYVATGANAADIDGVGAGWGGEDAAEPVADDAGWGGAPAVVAVPGPADGVGAGWGADAAPAAGDGDWGAAPAGATAPAADDGGWGVDGATTAASAPSAAVDDWGMPDAPAAATSEEVPDPFAEPLPSFRSNAPPSAPAPIIVPNASSFINSTATGQGINDYTPPITAAAANADAWGDSGSGLDAMAVDDDWGGPTRAATIPQTSGGNNWSANQAVAPSPAFSGSGDDFTSSTGAANTSNTPAATPLKSSTNTSGAPAIHPATSFNPERLALLSAPPVPEFDEKSDAGAQSRDDWSVSRNPSMAAPHVTGFNAAPLAFNRWTGEGSGARARNTNITTSVESYSGNSDPFAVGSGGFGSASSGSHNTFGGSTAADAWGPPSADNSNNADITVTEASGGGWGDDNVAAAAPFGTISRYPWDTPRPLPDTSSTDWAGLTSAARATTQSKDWGTRLPPLAEGVGGSTSADGGVDKPTNGPTGEATVGASTDAAKDGQGAGNGNLPPETSRRRRDFDEPLEEGVIDLDY